MQVDFTGGMLFNISRVFFDIPMEFGNIRLYQVGENILESGSEIREHSQVCYEISYIISGQADFYVDGEKHMLTQGDIHVVSKDSQHKITVNSSGRLRYAYLGFDILDDGDKDISLINYYRNKKCDVLKDNGTLFTAFSQFINELHNETDLSIDVYAAYVRLVLIYVYRIAAKCSPVSPLKAPCADLTGGTVLNIVKYIDANISFITKVSDIANNLNYSPSYISRIFKAKMNMTIRDYINKKKIEKGMELIKSEKLKMREIADYLHFDSYRTFNKVFKRITGMSPTEFEQKEGGC